MAGAVDVTMPLETRLQPLHDPTAGQHQSGSDDRIDEIVVGRDDD